MGRGGGKTFKTRKVIRALRKLEKGTALIVFIHEGQGDHAKVENANGTDFYPLPTKHSEVIEKYLVRLAKKLEKWGVCLQAEFMEMVK